MIALSGGVASLVVLAAIEATATGLPQCPHPLRATVQSYLSLAPSMESERYTVPDEDGLSAMDDALTFLMDGKQVDAFHAALVGGYWLCARADVIVGVPAIPGFGHAVFAYRPMGGAPLILEAPHPRYDRTTGAQAVRLFQHLDARLLVVAGTHRCANAAVSGCEGETEVCGTSDGYRESDMAHAEQSMFMTIHRAFTDRHYDDLVVSIHGMGEPGVSISDGTTLATTATSAVARLAGALREAFPRERITTCNAYEGAKVAERLCGTTNVQGRHLNGAVINACTSSAYSSTGRFLHLEQSRKVRNRWRKVAAALRAVLPEVTETPP